MKKAQIVSVIIILFLTLSAGTRRSYARVEGAVLAGSALGTGFTYQGQLKNSGGSPITSTCSFNFSLYDALSGGLKIGSTSSVTGVSVANGFFTAQVNSGGEFGAGAFNGEARWLEIAVQCTGDGSFITLSPLQPVTPAPYALAMPGLYTQTNATTPNIIGGYSGNIIASGIHGATISGGGDYYFPNSVTQNFGTVSGGDGNTADGIYAVVAGGDGNTASGIVTSVGGGESNSASGYDDTVGGGSHNTADGGYSTVPGGSYNTAHGYMSFAAGQRAKATNTGTFVWADSTNTDFTSTADNQFLVRAGGGVGINTASPIANTLTVNTKVIAGGTTAPSGSEPFVSEGAGSGISLDDRTLGSGNRWVIFPTGGALVFYDDNGTGTNRAWFTSGGVLTLPYLGSAGLNQLCSNASNQVALCSSSLRYKDNVGTLTLGLETIAKLRPVTFDWKDTGTPDLGFVAEEVDQVTPLLTTLNADGQIEGVKYDRISALLVKGMQEQQEQITDLQAQIASLKQGRVSPFATPWPWLALTVLGGLAIMKREGGRI
jgi:hypothetical protein